MLRLKLSKNFLLFLPLVLLVAGIVFIATTRRVAPQIGCQTADFSGVFDKNVMSGIFEGASVAVPSSLAEGADDEKRGVLGVSAASDRWIEVDLSEQKMRAWDGSSLFLESPTSTGLPGTPTPKGEFRIWSKFRFTKMEGGSGRSYYYLPNVPFVMFFQNASVPGYRGYSLHGTYWHNDFGRVRSHGCVNLPTPIAEKLYWWVSPVLPDGKKSIAASADNPGTRIIIHD